MHDLTITSPAGESTAYLAVPETDGPAPGVVVIHDAFGLGNEIRGQADWLASEGYLAVAPDLIRGRGKLACMVSIMRDARDRRGATFDDIEAARSWLIGDPRCSGTVGVIGFCMGGGLAASLATVDAELAGAVDFYGQPPPAEKLSSIRCPILGLFGEDDPRLVSQLPAFEENMKKAGRELELRVYPGAPHAFFNDTRPSYRLEAARDAWARTLSFFARNLA